MLQRGRRTGETGLELKFSDSLRGRIYRDGNGKVHAITLFSPSDIEEEIERVGHVPLPPYIKRPRDSVDRREDRERYQTVYGIKRGAVAAPTAGLHFTERLLGTLGERGVEVLFLTLHVGLGSFEPVGTEIAEDHRMHREYFDLTRRTADRINSAKSEGRRVVAVGTTTTRCLESRADEEGRLKDGRGWTELFIYPGYRFKIVDRLITNFHLPRSTLLMLVSAFCTRDLIMEAYREAVSLNYRFYSYGDAMFIL